MNYELLSKIRSVPFGSPSSVLDFKIRMAIDWLKNNTTIDCAVGSELAPSVQLFICKYIEIIDLPTGVTSESVDGLSQSFTDNQNLIDNLAKQHLNGFLKSKVKVIVATKRWG